MLGAGAGPRKLDLTRDSMLPATAKQLWPLLTDLGRWPAWFKDARGQGLAGVEKLPHTAGKVQADSPELGQRYRLRFSNGLEGEWRVTYWLYPAQISLGLVSETRKDSQGIEGMILDCDLFPVPGKGTKLWFGALLLLEKGFKARPLARWPKREVMGWVQGFHDRVAADARGLAKAGEDEPREPSPARPPRAA